MYVRTELSALYGVRASALHRNSARIFSALRDASAKNSRTHFDLSRSRTNGRPAHLVIQICYVNTLRKASNKYML